MKKILKTVFIIITLIITNFSLFSNCVQAQSDEVRKVYEIDYCDKVLTFKGTPIGAVYVVHKEDGKEYPAYCIDPKKIGVGETDAYDVSVSGNITDVGLWRVVVNGYPYKTLDELGVENKKEAYLATKQAIYCYLSNRGTENYSFIGESGRRTLNALNQILNDAKESSETKTSNKVDIIPNNTQWKQDEKNSKYVSKTYKVEYAAPITNYDVEVTGENIPDGMLLTDINNNPQKSFKPNQEFKILIPTNLLNNNGNFEISVKTKMDTKPVLYGVSPNSDWQNYALTLYQYEDSLGTYKEEYQKNKSQITILKQDKDTKVPLKGVEFRLLDENNNIKLQNLITDENGKILIDSIEPGTYFLQEVKTLQGYILYDENIKFNINLNEKLNITVNNAKEKRIEITEEESNIEVSKEEKEEVINKVENIKTENIKTEKTKIEKLPKTGM